MKNAKKVLAMVIVLALAISMAIPASAADSNTINISNAQEGYTYTAWKMADLSYNSAANAYKYFVADGWEAFFADPDTGAKYFTVKDYNGESVIEAIAGADMAQAAKDAVAYAKANAGLASFADEAEKVDNDVIATIDVTAGGAGYYCVDSNLGVICSLGTNGDNEDADIVEKNDKPTISKVVNDKAFVDASYGDTVHYTITIDAKAGAQDYVVTDILSKGLTYDEDTFDFTVVSDCEDKDDITVTVTSVTPGENGTTIIFTVNGEEEVLNEKDETATITITYDAVVNQNAIVDTNDNKNNAELAFGENNEVASIPVPPVVYVWSFDIFKYRDAEVALKGAEFTLYNEQGKALKFDSVNGVYKYAGVAGDGEEGTALVANDDAKYFVDGLIAGTYTLKETKVPDGFNKSDDITVVISNNATATEMTKSIAVDGEAIDGDLVKVINNAGVQLPSTGGVGTVIFVAVGSFLVMAMGVLLVVRKRMSKVVYTR